MARLLKFVDAIEQVEFDLALVFGWRSYPAAGIEFEALDILSGGFVQQQLSSKRFAGAEDEAMLLQLDVNGPRKLLWVGLGTPIRYWIDWADRCAERLQQWTQGLRPACVMLIPPDFVNADQADYAGWGQKWQPVLQQMQWLESVIVATDYEVVEGYHA